MTGTDPLYGQAYFDYLHHRSSLRRRIRRWYLQDIRSLCRGRTVDFGCGAGELLAMLPQGSVGLEVNPVAVAYGQSRGLDVRLYDPASDGYRLDMLSPGTFDTFTANHVFEHLDDSAAHIAALFTSCFRLGIRRLVITVPGRRGFATDPTHRTFVDEDYLRLHGVTDRPEYTLVASRYYPINSPFFSRFFAHNELRLVFDQRK
jgi:SAM-dependent methyltransferase